MDLSINPMDKAMGGDFDDMSARRSYPHESNEGLSNDGPAQHHEMSTKDEYQHTDNLTSSEHAKTADLEDGEITVRVRNQSSLKQPFIIFPAAPTFNSGSVPRDFYSCVYAGSGLIAAFSGTANFVVTTRPSHPPEIRSVSAESTELLPVYAVTGYAFRTLKPGLTLYYSDTILLTPRTASCKMISPPGHEPHFDRDFPASPSSTQFTISVGSFDPNGKVAFVGLGLPNSQEKDQIFVTAVWAAIPRETYNMTPSDTWWVARAERKPGTTILLDDFASTINFNISNSISPVVFDYLSDGNLVPAKERNESAMP